MKKLAQLVDVDNEGLVALLGKRVMVFCMNYIYTGTLAGVNTHDILLEDAAIVYSTGAFTSDKFDDAQKLKFSLYVRTGSIESYSETDKK